MTTGEYKESNQMNISKSASVFKSITARGDPKLECDTPVWE